MTLDKISTSQSSHIHQTIDSTSNNNKRSTTGHLCDEIEVLKLELEQEQKNRLIAQSKYSDLNRQIDLFSVTVDDMKKNPESKYDTFILKQNCVNDSIIGQIHDAKEKLAHLTQSLKSIQVCGKGKNYL